jgi:molybdopterin molybdotransferase
VREADWLLIEEALEVMMAHVPQVGTEPVDLDDAVGRVLAGPIISPIHQPPWDNSAMDGFAVHAADVRTASDAAPVLLRIVDDVRAGGFPAVPVRPGEATRIMTGAPMPVGADSVVRVEHTRTVDALHVAILRGDDAGRNIRLRGEDVAAGVSVFSAGLLLRPAEVGVLAMLGCTRPLVARAPRVAVLATGDELVPPERIADVVAGTHIVNSNTPALQAALRQTGCIAEPLGIARDDLDDLRSCLERALTCDALITTAGASVGDHDLVKDALEALGCRTLFWRVRIRPGSPFSFGVIERPDAAPLPVFGLPGNPVSALVTFEVLVRPALRHMQGRTNIFAPTAAAVAGEVIKSPPGLVRFLRVALDWSGAGPPRAYLTGPQGSGILTSVSHADGLLVMPLDVARLAAGDTARVVPLHGADDAAATLGFSSGG